MSNTKRGFSKEMLNDSPSTGSLLSDLCVLAQSLLPKKRPSYIEESVLGCYKLVQEFHPRVVRLPSSIASMFDLVKDVRDSIRDWHYVVRFLHDCLSVVGSRHLALYIMLQFPLSITPAVSLYLSASMMTSLELLDPSDGDTHRALYRAVGAFVAWKVVDHYASHLYSRYITPQIYEPIGEHFEDAILRARLRLDIPTYNDPAIEARFSRISDGSYGSSAFSILDNALAVATLCVSLPVQVMVLLELLRKEDNGLQFAVVAALPSLVGLFSGMSKQSSSYYLYLINKALVKLQFVQRLNKAYFHRYVVIDGLQDHLTDELTQARKALKGVNTDMPWNFESRRDEFAFWNSLSSVSKDMPLILYTLYSLYYRAGQPLPFKTLTLISTSATSLSGEVGSLLQKIQRITGFHNTVREFYDLADISNFIKDGDISYPPPSSASATGMKIEFRSVSFSYPGHEQKTIRNMSFIVHPGQMCVIVGENGCGKSSTLSLINRIYDVSGGQILIDDVPINRLQIKELRQAQAVLHQDWVEYPTTISENIGFGSIEHRHNESYVRQAADAAGASEWITKLPKGFNSTTAGQPIAWSSFKEDSRIAELVKGLERKVQVSGGQRQRMAIARNFMKSIADEKGKVRLLCYDEPSSALDPKAEFALFERLRNERAGRTLIFITHRFGHLTKHADIILCIKDGQIEEAGSHEELVKLNGNYAQLYDIQARAFT